MDVSQKWIRLGGHRVTASQEAVMRSALAVVVLALLLASPARAQDQTFPASFKTQNVPTNGTSLFVRTGGKGPPVVLLHGFADTGDMWVPLAIELAKDHSVIIPDLRGMGLSAKPEGGYEKKNQARDIAGVLDALKVEKIDLVAHDIGNTVAYAFAAQYPARVKKLILMDAPLPGIGDWTAQLLNPLFWHFNFRGPDAERLVKGRERIYLDRFYNELAADPSKWSEAARNHYAELYAQPGAMRAAFNQFAAFSQDAKDNQELLAKGGKLSMPVLAVGGDHSYGPQMAEIARFAAFTNVQGQVIASSGHWLMEEQPTATVAAIRSFLGPVSTSRT